MSEEQYEDVMRELAELKEMAWSREGQEQLIQTLNDMSELMEKQTLIAKQHAEIFERMEKYLIDEEEEPEPKPLMS